MSQPMPTTSSAPAGGSMSASGSMPGSGSAPATGSISGSMPGSAPSSTPGSSSAPAANSAPSSNSMPLRRANSDSDPRFTLLYVIIAIIIVIALVLGYVFSRVFHTSPYGPELRIDNFAAVFPKVSEDRRDQIFSGLYSAVANYLPAEEIPSSGAQIRTGSASYTANQSLGVYEGSAIIDIPTIEQSYTLSLEEPLTSGGSVASYDYYIGCVTKSEMIYPAFGCRDAYTEYEEQEASYQERYPIIANLPISIAYYDSTGEYIAYNISAVPAEDDNQELIITIVDYSGSNYERALDRLRTLSCGAAKCNPADYTIQYIDRSE